MSTYDLCTEVTPQCPIDATTYGYRPNLPGNIIFLVVFALFTIGQLSLGIKYRLPAFGSVVTLGCLGEAIGYGGRLIMHHNPWSQTGFKVQIVCLILSPSFLAAGIYLTLKHIVLALGPEHSRLRPTLYTWIFCSCDAFSIVLQATGGGIASAGGGEIVDIGNDVMIAGIAVQVGSMFICMILAVDFGLRVMRARKASRSTESGGLEKVQTHKQTTAFYFYLIASSVAFVAIFIRCVYRLPEMAGGWGNPLMQDEKEFLILDGAMVALGALLMTIAHPGIFFPDMRMQLKRTNKKAAADVESGSMKEEKRSAWSKFSKRGSSSGSDGS